MLRNLNGRRTSKIRKKIASRFARIFSLFFNFSKTPNCFTYFRLPFSKGAPLFVEIARNAFLEQQHFRTCPLKPHAGKSFRNREFLFSRPDWEREFSDLLRHGACAGKLRKRYPQIRVSFAKATNVAFRLAALCQTSRLFQQPRLTSFFHEGLHGSPPNPGFGGLPSPARKPAYLPACLPLSRSPSLSLSLCPCLSLSVSLPLSLSVSVCAHPLWQLGCKLCLIISRPRACSCSPQLRPTGPAGTTSNAPRNTPRSTRSMGAGCSGWWAVSLCDSHLWAWRT